MLPPCNNRNGFAEPHTYSRIYDFLLASGKGQAVFILPLSYPKIKKTMAKAAKTPNENDFLEELDSYGCGLGIPSLIHAQAYFIRFVLQNKTELGYTDNFANELITGASFAIDIFASIDNRIQTNLV